MRKPEAIGVLQNAITSVYRTSSKKIEFDILLTRVYKEVVVQANLHEIAKAFDGNGEILNDTIIGIAIQLYPDLYLEELVSERV